MVSSDGSAIERSTLIAIGPARKSVLNIRTPPADERIPPASAQRLVGRLQVTSSGFGFVGLEGGESAFIGRADLGPALDGDEVEVELTGRTDKGPRGKVLNIFARAPRRLVGVIKSAGRFFADDNRVGRPLLAPAGEQHAALCGVELVSELREGAPEIRIVRHFGQRGNPRDEENALLWREGIADEFPNEVVAEAEARARLVYTEPDPLRKDLRRLEFVSIDPATAEDHDDALFAERTSGGGARVWIAIADVAAFVPSGGPLDREAQSRGTSLYLPRRVVPMLPSVLSRDAASLVPGVDRVAMVLELELDADQGARQQHLALALIRSRAKLTYEDAGTVLESQGKAGSAAGREHTATLLLLDQLAQRLRKRRRGRGAMAFESTEVRVETDEATGFPNRIYRPNYGPWLARSHQMVEELMLLANETVGNLLLKSGAGALFRAHDAPSERRVARMIKEARRHGVEISNELALDPVRLRDFVQTLPGAEERAELAALLLEAMPSALYSARREDHFALASRNYVHFTSPIRRYADVTIHRAIRATLLGVSGAIGDLDPEAVNRTQQRARALQREVNDLYSSLLMRDRIGEEYDGTLVRVLKQQSMVALDEPAVTVRCPRPSAALEAGARVTVRIDQVSIPRLAIEGSFVVTLGD
jgi:ribonuclease R